VPEKIADWLKEFAPQYRVPQLVITGSPFLAQHLATSPFFWPPLGGLEVFAAYAAMVLIALCSFLPSAIGSKRQAKAWLDYSFSGAVLAFLIYAVLVGRYVITVETPHDGTQVRSVGFNVEPSIRAMFPREGDPELLRIGGLEDWQIQKVWTPGSVLAARLCILTSFSATLALANVALGSAARLNKKK